MASLNDLKGQLNKLLLDQMEWDCCIVGNGVAALWAAHQAWASKRSVLWLGSDDPFSASRALCSHGWSWGAPALDAAALQAAMGEDPSSNELPFFELAYFDARSSKRLRSVSEVKLEWGQHEADFLKSLSTAALDGTPMADLWAWYERIYSFHNTGGLSNSPSTVELFSEPRFVRLHHWPVQEMEARDGRIQKIGVGLAKGELAWIQARQFIFTDYEENLATQIKDPVTAEVFSAAFKGRAYHPGFGLRLRHKNFSNPLSQTVLIPLSVSPEKGKGSHVVGRFLQMPDGSVESYWAGLLTDEEVEDNNEILKKIKHAKRAVDRALPGFLDSVEREAVTFEPKMFAKMLKGNSGVRHALGAWVLSDQFGMEPLLKGFLECLKSGPSVRIHAESSIPST